MRSLTWKALLFLQVVVSAVLFAQASEDSDAGGLPAPTSTVASNGNGLDNGRGSMPSGGTGSTGENGRGEGIDDNGRPGDSDANGRSDTDSDGRSPDNTGVGDTGDDADEPGGQSPPVGVASSNDEGNPDPRDSDVIANLINGSGEVSFNESVTTREPFTEEVMVSAGNVTTASNAVLLTNATNLPARTTVTNTTTDDQIPELTTSVLTTYEFMQYFEGDCIVLKTNKGMEDRFLSLLKQKLVNITMVNSSLIETRGVACGSVIVPVSISTMDKNEVERRIDEAINLGGLNISVSAPDGQIYDYIAIKNPLSFPSTTTSTARSVTSSSQPISSTLLPGVVANSGMKTVDIVIIVVFAVVIAVALIVGIVWMCCRCYSSTYKDRFELGESPPTENADVNDFTLTRMNRPMPAYTDKGIIINRDTMDEPLFPTLPKSNKRRVSDDEMDNGDVTSEKPVVHVRNETDLKMSPVSGSPGYDNPSFSEQDSGSVERSQKDEKDAKQKYENDLELSDIAYVM